jgi:outer membrane protein assembly factor BamB
MRFPSNSRTNGFPGACYRLALLLPAAALAHSAGAADWPQWRGPLRNGISAEKGWTGRWPAGGPRKLWETTVGAGFSSVAIKGGRLYTMGNAGNRDTVHCLNAATGKTVWTHSYPCAAGDYAGPRSTPTVDGKVVYTLSREGHAFCLNADTGKVVWGKDLKRETGAQPPRWGFAGSPLVDSGRVVFNVGSAGCALDGAGRVVWKSGRDGAGYASPVAFSIGAQRGVAIFAASGLAAVNPVNGRRLWHHAWETNYGVNAADPIFSGNQVFVSSNYGKGGALLQIDSSRPSVVWENRNMRNHVNSCVLVGGALFGNDENTLKCIDWSTGAERWRQRGFGKGGLIASDGKLIGLSERGELFTAAATPAGYRELSRAQVVSGSNWSHPVLSGGRIYCRSQQGTLVCLDVSARP